MAKKQKPDKQEKNRIFTPAQIRNQFKPGQSGNPAGRPPDPFTMSHYNKQGLAEIVPKRVLERLGRLIYGENAELPKEFTDRELTWGQAISIRNRFRALTNNGDKIIELMWVMADGKPVTRIAGPDGGPVEIKQKIDTKKLSTEKLKLLRDILLEASVEEEENG